MRARRDPHGAHLRRAARPQALDLTAARLTANSDSKSEILEQLTLRLLQSRIADHDGPRRCSSVVR